MSNGGSDAPSCRYTDKVLVNGGPPAEQDDEHSWCGKFDVKSLLQDAPVDSIRQRTQVDREESITESPVPDDDGAEKVDLDFNDGQV